MATPEPQHFVSQLYLEPVLRDVDTGEQRSIRSRFLVGADGAASIVRKAIGAKLEGIPELNHMCSTCFRSARVGELVEASPGWMLRFVGGGILVAIDGDKEWLLHHGVPGGEDPETWDPEAAMFAAIGEPFDYEVIDRSRWTPRAMVADRWRDGNVFLAGDAAHIWVPMGGFGMNAGVADATALSWRLARRARWVGWRRHPRLLPR